MAPQIVGHICEPSKHVRQFPPVQSAVNVVMEEVDSYLRKKEWTRHKTKNKNQT